MFCNLIFLSVFSPNAKRKYKDNKFGFGGKKKGSKWNTKDSHDDVSGFRSKVAHGKGGKKFGKGGKSNVGVSFLFFYSLSINPFRPHSFSIFLHRNGQGKRRGEK